MVLRWNLEHGDGAASDQLFVTSPVKGMKNLASRGRDTQAAQSGPIIKGFQHEAGGNVAQLSTLRAAFRTVRLRRMTQLRLAEAAGIGVAALRNMEQGRGRLNRAHL